MATPLYKSMRDKGTSFYAFPSAIKDFSLANFQDNFKINPTKFVLLNIPRSVTGTTSEPGVLDFRKTTSPETFGIELYNFDPNTYTTTGYADQLVEGLRNYVANADTIYRESKLTVKKDFYNVTENETPVEKLFWKWCKKMNFLDLEPAVHKIDWDKNLSDFQNPNASTFTNRDYFRKYLWKEREIIPYSCTITDSGGGVPEVTILDPVAKFKPGDKVTLSGYTGTDLLTGITYYIDTVSHSSVETTLTLDSTDAVGGGTGSIELVYHRLVQYIGEVQAISKVQTSENYFTEFTAMIPPHAGQTPTVLWGVENDSNYYPGLEIPILAEEIQHEIKGSEYLSSPIRTNPGDYPGSYFGYFDTYDKTYQTSTGDAVRLKGDYYGILREYNDGVADDDYEEKLIEFNSATVDGLSLDFSRKHYLKMNLPGSTVKNFDEFNAMVIDETPPSDFEFNAILWYYELDDGSGTITTNLYGIEFLNNPDDDFGLNDDRTIGTTRKLVTSDSQDGLSYMYNLNLDFKVDNEMVPLEYDPTSVYNLFGFDLYNNVMANYGKLNQNFMTIIDEFVRINKNLLDMKSIIYSQTDMDEIKARLESQEELIKLYQTNQIVESDTIGVEVDYTKNYPAIKFNTKYVEYDEIYNYHTTDIVEYNISHENTGDTAERLIYDAYYNTSDPYVGSVRRASSWPITVSNKGRTLVNIYSNIVNEYPGRTLSVALSKDLAFKQSMDFIIRADICQYLNNFQINIMFDDGTGTGRQEEVLFDPIDLPIDVSVYNSDNPTGSTFNNSYYFDLETYIDSMITGTTTEVDINEDLFDPGDWVYIDAFYMNSGGELLDYSGLYYVTGKTGIQVFLDWDSSGTAFTLEGRPRISYYRGAKISILRIDDSKTSDIDHRYLITREFLTSEYVQKLNL
jgi:hypothetical protein